MAQHARYQVLLQGDNWWVLDLPQPPWRPPRQGTVRPPVHMNLLYAAVRTREKDGLQKRWQRVDDFEMKTFFNGQHTSCASLQRSPYERPPWVGSASFTMPYYQIPWPANGGSLVLHTQHPAKCRYQFETTGGTWLAQVKMSSVRPERLMHIHHLVIQSQVYLRKLSMRRQPEPGQLTRHLGTCEDHGYLSQSPDHIRMEVVTVTLSVDLGTP